MKNIPAFIFAFAFLMSVDASGINPKLQLTSFDAQRGFPEIISYKDAKTGMTDFRIVMNPKIFLSHFKHGFPKNVTQVEVTLRAKNAKNFRGVTIDFRSVSSKDPEFLYYSFSVPSSDLSRYDLEFQCSVVPADDTVIIGGELYVASLQDIRDAKATVTESDPIWQKLENEHRNDLKRTEALKTEQGAARKPSTRSAR